MLRAAIAGMTASILIVDANATALAKARDILTGAGYEVRAVSSFEEGKRELTRRLPDVLIADVRLGLYNGLHLILRTRLDHPEVAAVLTHTVMDPVLEGEARNVGASYLVMPEDPAALLALVGRLIEQPTGEPPSRARRWQRNRTTDGLPASIDHQPAAVFDVSYGGLRLELPQEPQSKLPGAVVVNLPDLGLSIKAQRVWWGPAAHSGGWWCGVQVVDSDLKRWHSAVDTLKAPPRS